MLAPERVPADVQALGAATERPLTPGFPLRTTPAVGMNFTQKFTVDAAGYRKSFHGAEKKAHTVFAGNLVQYSGLVYPLLESQKSEIPALIR